MMLRLATGEFLPRVSNVNAPRLSNALSFSSFIIDGLSRKGDYEKLPEEPIKLSVRKLDGSCFDIKVSKIATVAELKLAVEASFCDMQKNGQGQISWPHVWGHFCLSFEGQKLVADTDYIKDFFIKDGDQLQFVRHITSNCNLTRKQSKKRDSCASAKEQDESLSPSNSSDEREEEVYKQEDYEDCDDVENGRYRHYDDNGESIGGQNESSFGRLLHLYDGKRYIRAEASRDDPLVYTWREDLL